MILKLVVLFITYVDANELWNIQFSSFNSNNIIDNEDDGYKEIMDIYFILDDYVQSETWYWSTGDVIYESPIRMSGEKKKKFRF